jgi:hypothetical protein
MCGAALWRGAAGGCPQIRPSCFGIGRLRNTRLAPSCGHRMFFPLPWLLRVLPAARITRFCCFSRIRDAVFVDFSRSSTASAQRTQENVVTYESTNTSNPNPKLQTSSRGERMTVLLE